MANLVTRFAENPLLRPSDLKPSQEGMVIECLLNPGVFRFQDKIWMVIRVAERPIPREGKVVFAVLDKDGETQIMDLDRSHPDLDQSDPRVIRFQNQQYLTTLSHFRLVCSSDGIHFHEPEGYAPIFGRGSYETYGIEDCRVSFLNQQYFLTYTAVSPSGVGVGMTATNDWIHFDRRQLIFPPHNKDCALFEEKIDGKYFALHRPSSPFLGGNFIWLAESADLVSWGNHQCVAQTRPGLWDSERVGAGAAPIRTAQGWLVIYHGADERQRYCLGALLLDLKDPSRVIGRTLEPIMEPETDYETKGFFGNVIFTNGHVVNGDLVTIYYGAADEVICGATVSIREILKMLL